MTTLKVTQVISLMQQARAALAEHAGANGKVSIAEAKKAKAAALEAGELVDLLLNAAVEDGATRPVPLSRIESFVSAEEARLREVAKNQYVSKAEEKQLDGFALEAVRVSRSQLPASGARGDAMSWADGRDFLSTETAKLKIPRTKVNVANGVPASVVEAYNFYLEAWEGRDLGSVSLFSVNSGGSRFFAVHNTSDGDEGFLELYDARGHALASGETKLYPVGDAKQDATTWDSRFGAIRKQATPPPGPSNAKQNFHAAWQRTFGTRDVPYISSEKKVGDRHVFDVHVDRVVARVELVTRNGKPELGNVKLLEEMPTVHEAFRAQMADVLASHGVRDAKVRAAFGDVKGFTLLIERNGRTETVFWKEKSGSSKAVFTHPAVVKDAEVAKNLAASVIRDAAMGAASSPMEKLAAQVKLSGLEWRLDDLEKLPATTSEPFRFRLSDVLGETDVVAVLGKDGTFRAELQAAKPAAASRELVALQRATSGMQNHSESESPVIAFSAGAAPAKLTAAELAKRIAADYAKHSDALVGGARSQDTQALSKQPSSSGVAMDFLNQRGQVFDVGDSQAEAYAKSWRNLTKAVNASLTDLQLFRYGTVEATYVLVGKTASGELCGFFCGAVET